MYETLGRLTLVGIKHFCRHNSIILNLNAKIVQKYEIINLLTHEPDPSS